MAIFKKFLLQATTASVYKVGGLIVSGVRPLVSAKACPSFTLGKQQAPA